MIIVADTTPLSELAKVGQLDLLRELFGQVIVPDEVFEELRAGNHPAALMVLQLSWLERRSIVEAARVQQLQTRFNLDLGESAAIVLAEELKADQLLVDERAARRVARVRQLPIIGTVGILVLAKQRGLLGEVKLVLDDLRVNGTRISDRLYAQALVLAREDG
jgi:uncharacterized protein